MNGTRGRAAVVSLLGSESVFVRRAAASALAAMGADGARGPLQQAAGTDSDEDVREMCRVALLP